LDQAQRSKLSSDSQKAYITAFYRNRMSLSEQNPDAADSWISSQVSRLAHQQTGLTAQGTSVAGANEWAQMQSNKLLDAAMGGMGGSAVLC
jgi:ABC-type Fe3+ transport system substrate-binding protein